MFNSRYSYGNSVTGAYHCQFGVIDKGSQAKPVYIKGMELTGSVRHHIYYTTQHNAIYYTF